jgi:DNA modification methylase
MKSDLFGDEPQPLRARSNRLYYGDNLTIMHSMGSGGVDLIYLDPPFNSQKTYNLIYRQMTGLPLPEQEDAFCDTWELDAEKEEMARRMPIVLREYGVDEGLVQFWTAWINALRHTQPKLLAYLVYMTYRLFEMKKILKPTGSIFLHCDPTASHYMKVIMDGIFGHDNFRNEIIWKRTSAHSSARRCGPVHDVILFYSKSAKYTWNPIYQDYDQSYLNEFYAHRDPDGRVWRRSDLTGAGIRHGETGKPWRGIDLTARRRHWAYPPETLDKMDEAGEIHWPKKKDGMPMFKRYLDEQAGAPLQDVWTDIPPIHNLSPDRLGYATQKPPALLERIISISTNPGELVFDPFCGCGTTIYAAHVTGRRWIGCDIAILSVRLVRDVLLKRYGLKEGEHYEIEGVPLSLDGAQDLFDRDPHQFQIWAVELAGGFSGKRSGDRGVDGRVYYETSPGPGLREDDRSNLRNMVISVKGGKLTPAYVRELRGVLERENDTDLGGFICLQEPTKGMLQEAATAGMFEYLGKDYPRLQIRTVDELLHGNGFETPSRVQTLNWEKQSVLPL